MRGAPAAAYLRARRLLLDGEAVCAFPEAGISHSFTVRSMMPGAAALARSRCTAERATSQTRPPLDTMARPCPPTYSKTSSAQRSGRPVTKTTGTPRRSSSYSKNPGVRSASPRLFTARAT